MRSRSGKGLAATAVVLALAWAAAAGESHELTFKFTDGAKTSYAIELDLDVATTAERGTQKQESSARTKLALAMDVVVRGAEEGVRAKPELAVTFRDLAVDQELSGPAGDVTLEIRGSDVVAKRDGATVVDTKRNLKKDLAGAILAEFAFLGEEGTLSVEESGRVTKVEGPVAFKSFLAQDSGAGLWILETKPGAVAAGESWESAERRISRFRGLDLSSNPLALKASYTLEEFSAADDRTVAKIAVRSDLVREKSLSATVTGEALKDVRVEIRKLERRAEGTVLFDVTEGRIVKSDVKVTLVAEIHMTVKNERTKKDELVKTSVKGEGTAVMALSEPPAGDAPAEEPAVNP